MNNYIVKNEKNIYSVYSENNCIYQRELTDTGWKKAEEIAVNTGGEFALMRSEKGAPVILYTDKKGNIMLSSKNFPARMVLRNTSDIRRKFHIEGIIGENTIRLFYSKDYLRESYITEQHRREDGSWSSPAVVDSCTDHKNMTKLICLKGNYILFYSKKVPEQQIGYREIGSSLSEFKLLYSTGYRISDYSLAVTEEEIHIAAVVNTPVNNKLVYVKKNNSGLSKAKVLHEGHISICCINIHNNKIHILFSTSSGNREVTSSDMGESFKRSMPSYGKPFNKAVFADYTEQVPDIFVASELVTDNIFPYKVKLCPFIGEDENNEIEQLKKEIEYLRKVAKH